MSKQLLALAILLCSCVPSMLAQVSKYGNKEKPAQVMLLGTFHFSYPNQDIVKVEKADQIDVTTPESQREIEKLVKKIAKFRPTKIAVEVMTYRQGRIDSLYQAYLNDRFELRVSEIYQIGFRTAKMLGHQRVYCIDTWGNMEAYTKAGSAEFEVREDLKERMEKFWSFIDTSVNARVAAQKTVAGNKTASLYRIIKEANQPENIRKDHANYFRETFQYEEKPYDYTGVDWYSSSWYSRNLRIFRNIQRITEGPEDRILVIYGSGHLALLQHAIESSPSHKLVPVHKLLN